MNHPRLRLYVAWFMLIGTLIGWPASLIWFAADEPPFILSLSWLAITITAWDVISTAEVRVKQEELEEQVAPDE